MKGGDSSFFGCATCARRWHGIRQASSFITVTDDSGNVLAFCCDSLNCAAVYAALVPGDESYAVAMAARAMIARREEVAQNRELLAALAGRRGQRAGACW